jgi:hypothetical protein
VRARRFDINRWRALNPPRRSARRENPNDLPT